MSHSIMLIFFLAKICLAIHCVSWPDHSKLACYALALIPGRVFAFITVRRTTIGLVLAVCACVPGIEASYAPVKLNFIMTIG